MWIRIVGFLGLVVASPVLGLPAFAQATQGAVPAVTAADVRFMQEMIGHHQQAVEMTALVSARTRRAQLRLLAERIGVSQTDEMALMRRWLRAHGGSGDATASHDMSEHDGHDMSGTGGIQLMPLMPGMLSRTEMAALRAARGARFDRLFLEGMIRHHGGALTMVEQLLHAPGAAQESSINRFVSDVDADQRAEIARMRRMLNARQDSLR